jgi:drug/metabolite transporter (DMT)-like permease
MPQTISLAKWAGTAFGVAGATLIALNLPISGWGFILFLVSSASWTVAGVMMREHSLILLNAAFTVINVIGIYRWLIA